MKNFKLYIDNVFKKRFIREFKLFVEYSILFIPKLNEKLNRLYIDYKKLNNIIIKDRYFLPLVYKFRDKLFKVIIFIKFDLYIVFNFI